MSAGEVQEIFRSKTEVRFEWRIWNIFSIRGKVGNIYSSPSVQFSKALWYLKIYPCGVSSVSKEWIGITLVKNNVAKFGRFTLGIRKADGTEEKILHDQSLPEDHSSFTVNEFLQRSDLKSRGSQLAPLNVFTVICAIRCDEQPFVGERMIFFFNVNTDSLRATNTRKQEWTPLDSKGKTLSSRQTQTEDESNTRTRGAEQADLDAKDKTLVSRETQTEDESSTCSTKGAEQTDLDAKGVCILRKQLKDLLQDGEDHDVAFKVKDRDFRAHRDMLRARSPVFAAMFKHEMKESTDDPIDIVDCSPEAFGEFLQYVYTGKVENFSTSTALDLYYVGDKYDVSGLKEICVEYLKTSLSTTAIGDVITLAAKYGEEELHELSMAFFLGIFGGYHEHQGVAAVPRREPHSSQ